MRSLLNKINENKCFLDLLMDVSKCREFHFNRANLVLQRMANSRVVRYKNLLSCFYHLSTGRVTGPKFFKSEWSREIT